MFSAVDIETCFVFEHLFGLDVPLLFEFPYIWEELFSFCPLFSLDNPPMRLFYMIFYFLDDGLLKLS